MKINYYPSITGLRAISVIFVILYHLDLRQGIFSDYIHINIFRPIIFFITDGPLGVNIFFVISGFLITQILEKEMGNHFKSILKKFYVNRILRIFPALLFMLLVYLILSVFNVITITGNSWLTSLTQSKYLNWQLDWETAHLWSLGVEEHFYIFWPFLFFMKNKKMWSFILIFITMIFRYNLDFFNVSWISIQSIFTRVDSILVGCLIAIYRIKIINLINKKWNLLFIVSLCFIFFSKYILKLINCINFCYIKQVYNFILPELLNVSIGLIILYISFAPITLVHKFLCNKILQYLGKLSYSLYLWQQLFTIGIGVWFFTYPQNLLFILFFSIISYHFIEKPFLKFKHILFKDK